MSPELKGTLVLAGCGKMGGAMLEGWLKSGVSPKQIVAIDPKPPQEVLAVLQRHGIRHNPPFASISGAEVLVIAVKPQVMGDVLPGLASLMSSKPVIISIAAGTTIATFEKAFGADAAVVRCMPNTPAAIGRGITGMVGNAHATPSQMALAETLLASTGEVVRVANESQIDFVTAVSGSGPAYVFLLAEAMAAAGEKLGLAPELAMKLARATVSGSGELLHQSKEPAATLRQNVTSPNGTTYAALQVLMAADGIQPLMDKAVAAAARRAKELAG
ncbi:MAG: pyrroline-5-carboxylate reductase [Alphaproteobacteria bacterium]|nr:pyrroline-5-carboxylate reductase [Alphaproteobacteria bacterium]